MPSPRSAKAVAPVYAVPALDRGLDIVEALSAARRPLTLSEIAAALKTTPGSLFRFLARLEQRGYLSRDAETVAYSLTLRLYAIALMENPTAQLLRKARLPMEALAAEIGESCHLSILLGDRLVVVAQAGAPSPVRLTVDTGSVHAAAGTTSGRLLVALRDASEWRTLAPAVPTKNLREIAAAGVSSGPSERLLGVHDIAVPVRLPGDHAALAVTHLRPAGRSSDPEPALLAALRRTAARITAELGL